MSTRTSRRRWLAAAGFSVILAACGSGAETEAADSSATPEADTDSGTSAEAVEPMSFEVFSSDEGAGCSVYVSVPEDAVRDNTDVRSMIWSGVVDEGFTTCGFSDVVEAGLISVEALDQYGQPDWTTVTEHGFFAVDGWNELLESCGQAPIPDSCAEQVTSTLSP